MLQTLKLRVQLALFFGDLNGSLGVGLRASVDNEVDQIDVLLVQHSNLGLLEQELF